MMSCTNVLVVSLLVALHLRCGDCAQFLKTSTLTGSAATAGVRFAFAGGLLLGALSSAHPVQASDVISPTITATVNLDIKFGTASNRQIKIGVYGNDAPLSSQVFLSLCSGENPWGVSYDLSQVSRIIKDKEIDFGKFAKGSNQKQETWMDSVGKVRIRSVNVAENTLNSDSNALSHDAEGVVSMAKGGGAFDFVIAPKVNTDLDSTRIVIGRVLSGMDVVNDINTVPASREDALGSKGAFSNAGKGFDGRAKLAMPVGKPLKKVVVRSCAVEDKASFASFLKL